MIKRVEGSLIRRVSSMETSVARIDPLEQDLAVLREALKNAGGGGGPEITKQDIARWNKNCEKTAELEELIRKLQSETEAIPRMQTEIFNILQV